MAVLPLEPQNWADFIGTSPDCLSHPQSAKNVDNVLSKATTRKHQKLLFHAVEPHLSKMFQDGTGIPILCSLVKFGTTATVDDICKSVMENCGKILECRKKPKEASLAPLRSLLECMVYRYDCRGEYRSKFVDLLKSLKYSQLLESSVHLLAVARLISQDNEFASSILSSSSARSAFLSISTTRGNRDAIASFCKILLSEDTLTNGEMVGLRSSFVYTSLSTLYDPKSSTRPFKEITLLLASYGVVDVVQKLGKCLSYWPDIHSRARGDGYAKIIAMILTRASDPSCCVSLVKAVIRSEKDIDERLKCRKLSQLQLLSAVAEKREYADVVSVTLGPSQERKLAGAATLYRNAAKPRILSTKEVIMQRIRKVRNCSPISRADNASKRPRE
uniref:Uncharacterized protein n=1 Tax=Trypanosoma congolense (strain IL3000) TaxID=1068625 RepID=G0UJJ3_TRYCI|nr:conserved hypothetical protein [Trypanosoma congolense IL3000]